jgi:hypothetical protein
VPFVFRGVRDRNSSFGYGLACTVCEVERRMARSERSEAGFCEICIVVLRNDCGRWARCSIGRRTVTARGKLSLLLSTVQFGSEKSLECDGANGVLQSQQ